MVEPKVIPIVARAFVSYTKLAGVRAFIRQIDVQIPVKCIKIGILTVLIILLFLLALFPLRMI